MSLYIASNAAMVTTTGVTATSATTNASTTPKVFLQIATPSTRKIRVVEWGISFDGSAAAAPMKVELLQVDSATTLTAHVAAGVQPYNDSGAPASLMTLGTTATGYSAAGVTRASFTNSRIADLQYIAPTTQYVKQWPLGREFEVAISKFLQVAVTASYVVNCYTYIVWEE